MPRPKQRTPELRDRVLGVAVEVLAREGVAGFTTRGVARAASTSPPAVYELFGDKGGLVRAVFFEGFRRLRAELDTVGESGDPVGDVIELVGVYRGFLAAHPVLADIMFSRPFTDFEASPEDIARSGSVREFIVGRIRRCVDAGALAGDPTDIAHALVALVQGLSAAENARRLGTSAESVDRRWDGAVRAMLDGFRS